MQQNSDLDTAIDSCLQLTDAGVGQTHNTTGSEDLYHDPSCNSAGTNSAQTAALIDFSSDSESESQSPVLIDLSPDHTGVKTTLSHNDSTTSVGKVLLSAYSSSSQQDSLI